MADAPFTIVQNIFKAPHPTIDVTTFPCAGLTRRVLKDFLDTADDGVIGVAPAYGTNCALSVLAFASSSNILIIRLTKRNGKKAKGSAAQEKGLLEELILCADSHSKFAFQMDVLATSFFIDLGLRLRDGVDLLSTAKASRHSLDAIMQSMGGVAGLNKPNVASLFEGDEKLNKGTHKDVALQAWIAWRAATLDSMAVRLKKVPRIDTSSLTEARLSAFAKMVRDASRLSALKPTVVRNEISDDYSYKKGRLHVTSTRFKTRVQRGDQRIEIQAMNQGRRTTVSGKTMTVDGRAARIQLNSTLPSGPIKVNTVGKEPPTNAEEQRTEIILKALQGTSAIADKPFFQAIWSPQEKPAWPAGLSSSRAALVPIHFSRELNDSQSTAVMAILSTDKINVIHGPPGTGKTTTIAAAVISISASRARDRNVWLVAQSNVAVKNIAEKLASVDFLDFKLLVSKDFHYDWHEHLYEKINPNLIRSDKFIDNIVATERLLLGSKVILCTLSMLSNPRISTITRLVPLQTVVVDEASQVEIGDFLPMIDRYSTSLKKLVFIGDDKQYRMPTQLGMFIGKHVYDNKLNTVHKNTAPCCQFIDVKKSKEVRKGSSWVVRFCASHLPFVRSYGLEFC
ncbi:P-loop containing nucleoside triphosphate hydrolase protein [Mycena epipterygia]|nr:P-loop containing nucleoside triphosphate hydrolase protein [Mycena epipterygia]